MCDGFPRSLWGIGPAERPGLSCIYQRIATPSGALVRQMQGGGDGSSWVAEIDACVVQIGQRTDVSVRRFLTKAESTGMRT